MLYTFFFGYLSSKVKMLFRIAVLLDFFLYVYIFKNYFNLLGNNFVYNLLFVLAYCAIIAFISWGIKNFIVKKKF